MCPYCYSSWQRLLGIRLKLENLFDSRGHDDLAEAIKEGLNSFIGVVNALKEELKRLKGR